MNRFIQFSIFFSIMVGVFTVVHFYLYRRLVVLPEVPQPWAQWLKWALITLASLPPLAFIFMRYTDSSLGRAAVVVAMAWMGLMFILLVHTLVFDGARLGHWLASKSGLVEAMDPDRRQFLMRLGASAVGGLGVASAGWGIYRALGSLKTVTVEAAIAGLPKAFDGFRIVQISDVHLGPTQGRAWMKEVVRRSNELKPDLVAITGDLVDGTVEQLRDDVAPLADLKSTHGTHFVTGNHEYYFDAGQWNQHLQSLGIRVLVNERLTLKRGKAALDIAGVGDPTGLRLPPGGGTDVAAAFKGKPAGRRSVLLAHQPRVAEEAHQAGADLVLAGHTHGGQIWPFHYLVYLQQPYLKGLNNHKGTQVYVSQGTGTWGPPLRIGTHAELTEIILRSA